MDTMTASDYLKMQDKATKKNKHPEHDAQVEVFEWAKVMSMKHPELELLHATPNGAFYGGDKGRWSRAKKMRDEGVKSGVPDIFLPVPMAYTDKTTGLANSMVAGLWIEMKAEEGKVSPEQEWWISKLEEYGYTVMVCYSADEAIKVIIDYLSWEK